MIRSAPRARDSRIKTSEFDNAFDWKALTEVPGERFSAGAGILDIMKFAQQLLLVGLAGVALGCGQKGPLVMPDAQKHKRTIPTIPSTPAKPAAGGNAAPSPQGSGAATAPAPPAPSPTPPAPTPPSAPPPTDSTPP
jgi:predicted small lipoprotein YifL